MLRTTIALFTVTTAFSLFAQETAPMAELAGPQWTVIGSGAADGACSPGDATYTFSAKQVVVQECAGGTWKSSNEVLETWSAGGKSGIAFGGAKYEVKSLPANAPACKGNAHCVRLTTVPDGKTDATRSIYLAH
jgi:hypothetical protein